MGVDGELAFYGGRHIYITAFCMEFITGSRIDIAFFHRYTMVTVHPI
jgi:hypothetical protein